MALAPFCTWGGCEGERWWWGGGGGGGVFLGVNLLTTEELTVMCLHCTLSRNHCPKGANISRSGFQKWRRARAEMDWMHQRCFAPAPRAITSHQVERNHWRQSAAMWPSRDTTAQMQLLCFCHTWVYVCVWGFFFFFSPFLTFFFLETLQLMRLLAVISAPPSHIFSFRLSNLQRYLNYTIYCNYIWCWPASLDSPPLLESHTGYNGCSWR